MRRFIRKILPLILVIPPVLISCGTLKDYSDPLGPFYSGSFAGTVPSAGDTFRVVSYNVKFGKNLEQAIADLRAVFGNRRADIILLQEMHGDGVKAVADSFDCHYIYYPASVHRMHERDFGNAIVSRWPIEDERKILLPFRRPFGEQQRIAVGGTVVAGGMRIRVYSVHTETPLMKYEDRLAQAGSVLEGISRKYSHVIVGGDFNSPFRRNIRDIEDMFLKSGFVRASKGTGWTARQFPFGLIKLELDHLFTSGFAVVRSGKHGEAEASDHVPVWTVLAAGRTKRGPGE